MGLAMLLFLFLRSSPEIPKLKGGILEREQEPLLSQHPALRDHFQ